MSSIFLNVRSSLYKVCKDFAAAQSPSWTPTIYNFDAFSENNALPQGDLIGLKGLTMDVDTDLVTIRCLVGLATEVDENLFRLDMLSGKLLDQFAPNTQFTIYDAEAGTPITNGKLTVGSGVSLSPVYQATQRPLKFLSFTGFLSTALSQ